MVEIEFNEPELVSTDTTAESVEKGFMTSPSVENAVLGNSSVRELSVETASVGILSVVNASMRNMSDVNTSMRNISVVDAPTGNLSTENPSVGNLSAESTSMGNPLVENTSQVIWQDVSLQSALSVQLLRLSLGASALGVNSLLLVTLVRFDVLHSPGNVIAGSLAVADACHGVSKLLVLVTDEPYSVQLPALCQLQTAFGLAAQLGNIALTFVMTVNRFIAIKYPLRYTSLVTTKGTLRAMALSWALILSIVSVLVILDWTSGDPQLELGAGYRCWSYRYMIKPVFSTLARPLYFSGLIISVIIYAWIKTIAQRHIRRIQDVQCPTAHSLLPPMGRANRTICKVLVLYAATTLPIILLDVYVPNSETHLASTGKGALRYLLTTLWFSNCYVNAAVYSLSNHMFRDKMKATIMCRQN